MAIYPGILDYKMFVPTGAAYPTSGLISRWAFDNNVNDGQGNYNLTAGAELSYSNTVYKAGGYSGVFNGSNSETYSTDVNLRRKFDMNYNWSISLWFRSATVKKGMLFGCDGTNTSPYKRSWIFVDTTTQIGILRKSASGDTTLYCTVSTLQNNTWYHVVGTYDGSTLSLYLNNTLIDDAASTFSLGSTDTQTIAFTIGGNSQNNVAQWTGFIDQVYLYDKALDTTEISQLYNSGSGI